jgi:hypothetical protein
MTRLSIVPVFLLKPFFFLFFPEKKDNWLVCRDDESKKTFIGAKDRRGISLMQFKRKHSVGVVHGCIGRRHRRNFRAI